MIGGIECTVVAIGPEIGTIPEVHHSKHARLDAAHSGCAVPFKEIEFLESLENPEGEIDLDAKRVEDLSVELVRQSSAYLSWLIWELQPARVGFCYRISQQS